MEFRQVRSFVAIVEEGGFSAAARKLHVTQPALTRQIKELEATLGLALLWRTKREIGTTAAGAAFLTAARALLDQAAESAVEARRAARGETGRLRIGFFSAAIALVLPSLINEYLRRHPAVRVELLEMNPTEQMDAFAEGRIDFGFNRPIPPGSPPHLAEELVYRDTVMAALPDRHPLTAKKRIAPAALAPERFVLLARPEAPQLVDQLVALCTEAGFSPNIALVNRQISLVLLLVACGNGVSLVPGCTRHMGQPGVTFRRLQGRSPHLDLMALWQTRVPSPTALAFLEVVRRQGPKIRRMFATPK